MQNPARPSSALKLGKGAGGHFSELDSRCSKQRRRRPSTYSWWKTGAGTISPVSAGKYIKKEIKTTEGTELHRDSGTRQKPLCSSVSSVVSQPSVQSILGKIPVGIPPPLAFAFICVHLRLFLAAP